MTPLVPREQACEPVLGCATHAPLAHWYAVTERVCVPVVSQVPAKPPHAPHAPYPVDAQALPVVVRAHACDCEVVTMPHAPAAHVGVFTARDCVPVSAHGLAKAQALHGP